MQTHWTFKLMFSILSALLFFLISPKQAKAEYDDLRVDVTQSNPPSPNPAALGSTVSWSVSADVSSDSPNVQEEIDDGDPEYQWSVTSVTYKTSVGGTDIPGDTSKVSFDSPNDSESDVHANFTTPGYYTVTCDCEVDFTDSSGEYHSGSNTVDIQFTVVGVKKIQYKKNGTYVDATSTVYVACGGTMYFKAIPEPDGASWPSNTPVWDVGSGDVDPGQNTLYAGFPSTPGSGNVTAKCGTSSVTVPVTFFQFWITNDGQPNMLSGCTPYSPKCDINFSVHASSLPSGFDLSSTQWSVTGGGPGTATPTTGSSCAAHFDSTATLTAQLGDATATISVPITPSSATILSIDSGDSGTALQQDTIGGVDLLIGACCDGFACDIHGTKFQFVYTQGTHFQSQPEFLSDNIVDTAECVTFEPPSTVPYETLTVSLQVTDYCLNSATTSRQVKVHHEVTIDPINTVAASPHFEPGTGGECVSSDFHNPGPGESSSTYSESSSSSETISVQVSAGVTVDVDDAVKATYGVTIGDSVSSTILVSMSQTKSIPPGDYLWWFRRAQHDLLHGNVIVWSADGSSENQGTCNVDKWTWASSPVIQATETPAPTAGW